MRCPYCGSYNIDRASFCTKCGRDLSPQAVSDVQRQSPSPSGKSTPSRPFAPPVQPQYAPGARTNLANPPVVPPPVTSLAPEPPAPFPPHTVVQLQQLETGALSYTVVDDTIDHGRKKVVSIVYRPCTDWQQVATLLKAFKEQQAEKFETVIVQGFIEKDIGEDRFTLGQLRFDRSVRLGAQTINRYQIETGNGFSSDAVRIVLSE